MRKKTYKKYYKVLSATVVFSMLFGSGYVMAAPTFHKDEQTQKNIASSSFTDLHQVSNWAEDAVLKMKEQGIMVGDPTGHFRPLDKMTRQEVASTIASVLHLEKQKGSLSSFRDVSDADWAKDAIEAVKTAGIMRGDEKGNFRPHALITREELAVLVVNAIKADTKGKGDNLPFADKSQVSPWAKAAVQVALEQGLLHGDGKNFNPRKSVQRQEAASVLSRLIDRMASSSHHAVIDAIKGDTVTINGSAYRVAESLKGLLNEENAASLQKANIDFASANQIITKITYLELVAGGKPAKTGEKEFSENTVLEGYGATIDGDVKVKADYVTIRNLAIAGDFEIGPEIENDFYGYKVHVNGKTAIKGGSPHTVVFEDGILGAMNVSKPNVRVEAIGITKVSDVTVENNTTIQADSSVSIPKVTVMDGVKSVTLNASIDSVVVESHNDIFLSGSGHIRNLTVQNQSYVTLNTTGIITNANVPDINSKIVMQTGSKITNLSIPTGAKVEDVVRNYTESKTQISTVNNGTPNTSSGSTHNSGGGGGKAVVAPTIVSVTPSSGSTVGGNVVMITGTGLTGATAVKFGGTAATSYTVNSNTQITATVPAGTAGTVNVSVTTPSGTANSTSGYTYVAVPNQAPTATYVTVSGTAMVGQTLTGSYTYGDAESDAEGTSTFKWYRGTASDGSDKVAISGATGATYQLVGDDQGKYIFFEVTPIASTGTITGAPVVSTVSAQITGANHSPTVQNTISQVNKEVTAGVQTVSLSNVFVDSDGDTLSYTATSSNTGVATVAVNGTDVKITPVNAGTATITVTASDGKGGTVQTQFNVTISAPIPANHAPTAGTIADQTAIIGGGDATISLAGAFADQDNDTLTYTAVSSDPSIAQVNVTGDQLSITPFVIGTATITVTASDGNGGSVQTTFQVNVEKKKTAFISELVWGQSDSFLQIIELYNPTDKDIEASKLKIVRSDGGDDITISSESQSIIHSGSTFTIGESFSSIDLSIDYNTMMNFYNDDTQPVELKLYYDGQLIDIAVFQPQTSLARVSGTISGSTLFDASKWIDEGTDYTDGLNSYTP
ncbi:S-layer homology domain-containing protein [Aneurinibacillus sp. REN35]|uniref:S-layer homology domain-containing protein n=1 Tax=Aneurinibacillus sp. REN35 TaxID=3237286 RepID=UPI0035291A9F